MSCIRKDKFELGQSRATEGPGVLGFYSGRDHVNRERAGGGGQTPALPGGTAGGLWWRLSL